MPNYIVEKINSALNSQGNNFLNSKILIIGAAYKKNVNDVRESPAIKIIENLFSKKANIFYHDDFIKRIKIQINKKNYSLRKKTHYLKSIELTKKNLKSMDIVCLVTDHDYINYDIIRSSSKMIVDCRGKFKKNKKIVGA